MKTKKKTDIWSYIAFHFLLEVEEGTKKKTDFRAMNKK